MSNRLGIDAGAATIESRAVKMKDDGLTETWHAEILINGEVVFSVRGWDERSALHYLKDVVGMLKRNIVYKMNVLDGI